MSDSNEVLSNSIELESDEEVLCSSESDRDSASGSMTIEESDASDVDSVIRRHKSAKTRKRLAVIESDSDDEADDVEDRALSPRTRMSITGIRPADLTDGSSSEIEYSVEEEEQSKASSNFIPKDSNGGEDQVENRAVLQETNDEFSISDLIEEKKDTSVVNSPTVAARYTKNFESDIKDKLSSTVYRTPKVNTSDNSDIEVVQDKADTIEILSSESDYEETEKSQPKLTAIPSLKNISTPKAKLKTKIELVSQEYFDKEVRKHDDLKAELINCEKLYDKIAQSLPDKGKQLSSRVERLRSDCAIKSKYIASLRVVDDNVSSPVIIADDEDSPSLKLQQLQEQRKASFNNEVPDWDELSSAVNQIQPKYTGKQGLATFNNQKVLTVDRLKELHGSLESCPAENVLADDPNGLKVTLMDHQKYALVWMNWRENQKPRGGILADDMGLGKTLTMISLVLACKNREDEESSDEEEINDEDDSKEKQGAWSSKGRRDFYRGGTLVVCPASLINQWEREVHTKVSRHRLTVCVHHGCKRETKPKHLRTYDLVITTYNIASREEKSGGALFGIKWKRIILDEAHIVRNPKSQISKGVCELKGKFRWALTGTPIQNKEMDVYALLKFLRCSPFDDLAHWKKWIDKSAGGQQRLNTIMKSLMLRRTKIQLQEKGELQCLPQKHIKIIDVTLDTDEMNVYQKIMIYSRTLFAQFLFQRAERNTDLMYTAQSSKPSFMQTRDPNGAYYKLHQKFTKIHKGSKEIMSHEILVLLLRLRQICCHPGLIDSMLEDEDAQQMNSDSDASEPEIDLLAQLNKLDINDSNPTTSHSLNSSDNEMRPEDQVMAKASSRVLQRNNPVFDLKRPSTKMLKVLDTLKSCVLSSGDKAIVVSQWTSVLNILKTHIEDQGIPTLSLDGSIPVNKRQDIVSEFNNAKSETRILLLSLTAGGVGLNLIGANHLLLIDLHWNPQLEAQAQDRIYRVGQKKDVIIYKFMCKDTVEERIKALQDHKLAIANNVLTGARATEGSKLTIEDLKGLFGL